MTRLRTTTCRGFLSAVTLLAAACGEDNRPPSLELVGDQVVAVGNGLRLPIVGQDPDGDRLQFEISGLPAEAELVQRTTSEALIYWNPSITDTEPGGRRYEVVVTASDGNGGVARADFGVTVNADGGAPAFDLPSGIVVDLADAPDLTLVIEVKDDDSLSVDIDMEEGPAGSVLKPAGPKTAYFYWEPEESQLADSVHRVVLTVEDEVHAPVRHILLLVLLNAEKNASCVGTPPSIKHTIPADAVLNAPPLTLSATVTDNDSTIGLASLHWTTGDPSDDGAFQTAALTESDKVPGLWMATVDPGAIASGGTLVHYYMRARDNDDATADRCDLQTRYPKSGYLTAAVYPPGSDPGACVDDAAEPDDTASAAPTVGAGVYQGRRLCGLQPDVVRVDVPAGGTLVAQAVREPSHGAVRLRLLDQAGSLVDEDASGTEVLQVRDASSAGGPRYLEVAAILPKARLGYRLHVNLDTGACPEDAQEPNDTVATAMPIGPGLTQDLLLCPGELDWYRLDLSAGQELTLTMRFEHVLGDLDVDLRTADGTSILAVASSESSTEELRWTAQGAGAVFARVYGHDGASNAYTLEVDVVDPELTCKEDVFGLHADAADALVLFQGLWRELVACPGAPDWYAVDLNGGETLEVLGQRTDDASRPLDVTMYLDPAGTPASIGQRDADGVVYAGLTRADAGRIYYRVVGGPGTSRYTLLQEVTDPAGPCVADRFEPNDTREQAKALALGVHSWLRMCGNDVDTFLVELEPFQRLLVATSHATGGFTDLRVVGPDGQTVVGEAVDSGPGPVLEVLAEEGGVYTISVVGFDVSATLGYDLAVQAQ